MKSLTESEKVAESWLEQRYGNVEKIEEAGRPDFVADGKEFEVKKIVSNNVLYFTEMQLESFTSINPTVIITDEEDVINTIKFEDASGKYNIYNVYDVSKPKKITVYVTEEEREDLRDKADQYGLSLSDFLRLKGFDSLKGG